METPEYYISPREFADLIVRSLDEQNYFSSDQKCHPEDLAFAFVAQAEALARGASYIIQRIPKTKTNG
jgi:hypothetical protein